MSTVGKQSIRPKNDTADFFQILDKDRNKVFAVSTDTDGVVVNGTTGLTGAVTVTGAVGITGATTIVGATSITGVTTKTGAVNKDVLQTAAHGAGAIGTSSFGAPHTYRRTENGVIITTIKVDITGLGAKGDAADDVIGLVSAAPDAYIGRYVTSTYGVVYKIEMSCIQLPTGSATITAYINLASGTASTGGYDDAVGDITVIDTASLALGETATTLVHGMTANDYMYLVEGDTVASTGVYTAGQYIITFYGHAALA